MYPRAAGRAEAEVRSSWSSRSREDCRSTHSRESLESLRTHSQGYPAGIALNHCAVSWDAVRRGERGSRSEEGGARRSYLWVRTSESACTAPRRREEEWKVLIMRIRLETTMATPPS